MTVEMPAIGRVARTDCAHIAGIVSCVPKQVIDNAYFAPQFTAAAIVDVTKMIGVKTRRWVVAGQSAADLCCAAGQCLLVALGWHRDSIDALIFVSQTPDFKLPATACSLHARLGLKSATIAFDINLGCSGYPYAIWLAMTMISGKAANRILIAVGDTISRLVDPSDRATAMLFGDAGTVTAIESTLDDNAFSSATFILGTDGSGVASLIARGEGFQTSPVAADGNLDGTDHGYLYMDGAEIFNFTLRTMPALVTETFTAAALTADRYTAYLFHQANLFMLKHLTKKLKLPSERIPINIDRYGNTSCASIPLLMTTELNVELKQAPMLVAMFGFGVGFSWSSASLTVGPLRAVELIEL